MHVNSACTILMSVGLLIITGSSTASSSPLFRHHDALHQLLVHKYRGLQLSLVHEHRGLQLHDQQPPLHVQHRGLQLHVQQPQLL